MPLYELTVTTNAQTDEGGAVTDDVEVEEKVIQEGMIFIDPGSNGEVRAQLRFGESNLLPHSNSETVRLPGRNGPAPINAMLPGVPTSVELRAWAPNADFQHEVVAQVEAVAPANAAQEVRLVGAETGTTARPARTGQAAESLSGGQDDT